MQRKYWIPVVCVIVVPALLLSALKGCTQTTPQEQLADLRKEITELKQQLAAKESPVSAPVAPAPQQTKSSAEKLLDDMIEHGAVIGKDQVKAYQDGEVDKKRMETEANLVLVTSHKKKITAKALEEKKANLQEDIEEIERHIELTKNALDGCNYVAKTGFLNGMRRQAKSDAKMNENTIRSLEKELREKNMELGQL